MKPTQQQIDDFKRDHPDKWAEARAMGAEQERARWRGIEAVAANLGPEHADLVRAIKADGRYDGSDLARAAVARMQNRRGPGVGQLAVQRDLKKDWEDNPHLRLAFNNNEQVYRDTVGSIRGARQTTQETGRA